MAKVAPFICINFKAHSGILEILLLKLMLENESYLTLTSKNCDPEVELSNSIRMDMRLK